jgi:hypothetical protein
MRPKTLHATPCLTLALLALATTSNAQSQPVATKYTQRAPVAQYLMADPAAEIALARTAAPDAIARNAEVLVLGPHGFTTAVKGSNGFVCIVGRGWTAAADPDYWNPAVRVPMCVNAPAAHSYLLRVMKETEWGLAGRTPTEMSTSVTAALARQELPPMEPGAMCYMMSREGYGGDLAPHWPSHLMFFYTDFDPAKWGANLPGSPVLGLSDPIEHLTQFVVVVPQWSDGTPYQASTAVHHH